MFDKSLHCSSVTGNGTGVPDGLGPQSDRVVLVSLAGRPDVVALAPDPSLPDRSIVGMLFAGRDHVRAAQALAL